MPRRISDVHTSVERRVPAQWTENSFFSRVYFPFDTSEYNETHTMGNIKKSVRSFNNDLFRGKENTKQYSNLRKNEPIQTSVTG